ncbi:hypothetical protein G7Y79_00044g080670 [Physcia stellaris]|nr:hypothetical protein G7Y79_00044g080670 [Physcia stellaris]
MQSHRRRWLSPFVTIPVALMAAGLSVVTAQSSCYFPNGTDAGASYGNIERADTAIGVTPCGDSSYCCGNGTIASNCCYNGNGFFIDPSSGDAVRTNPSPATSSVRHTVTASVSVTSAPTKKKSVPAGVIAGSVIAVAVVLAAGGVGAWIVLYKRRRARHAGPQAIGEIGKKYSEMPDSELASIDPRGEETDTRVPENVELDSGQRHEMLDDQTSVVRHELGT